MGYFKVSLWPGAGAELQTLIVEASTPRDALAVASLKIGYTVPVGEGEDLAEDPRYIYLDRSEQDAENVYLCIEGANIEELSDEEADSYVRQCLTDFVGEIISRKDGFHQNEDGTFSYEIYPYGRDQLSEQIIGEILRAETDDYISLLERKIVSWYFDEVCEVKSELEEAVFDALYNNGTYRYITEAQKDFVRSILGERVFYNIPTEHYLSKKTNTVIFLDSGDSNYDFVLNHIHPAYAACEDEPIDEKAGLAWLAKQQGYSVKDLDEFLRGSSGKESKFLRSVEQELSNLSNQRAVVAFILQMEVRDILQVNNVIRKQEMAQKRFWDATKRPECGSITLSAETVCGLFNPWDGGGSLMEIELERDVDIPIRFIDKIAPDEVHDKYEYGVNEVCGFVDSVWRKGSVVEVKIPEEDDC